MIYVHLPFCRKKCPYCHFFVLPDNEDNKDLLLKALLSEWDLIDTKPTQSIYFGGGTPALFGPERIAHLLDAFSPASNIEITLEANPEDVTLELMRAYRNAGINRLSLGVQSFDDTLLKMLGRTHSSQKAFDAIEAASIFTNLSIDLMYDIPGQTAAQFQETLDQIPHLPITHLSLYNLTFEPGSLFYKKRKEYSPLVPQGEESLSMLNAAVSTLKKAYLNRYEISAFALPGHEAIHNSGYWKGLPFHGLGPSAFSYIDGKRYRNIAHFKRYIESIEGGKLPIDFEERLPYPDNLHELLAVQLRLTEGVDLRLFEQERGKLPEATYQKIATLQEEGYLGKSPLALTERGKLFYDTVAAELI